MKKCLNKFTDIHVLVILKSLHNIIKIRTQILWFEKLTFLVLFWNFTKTVLDMVIQMMTGKLQTKRCINIQKERKTREEREKHD